MRIATLRRNRQAEPPPGTIGVARLDRRTKNLTKRLKPGEIAIIDHVDIDRVSADHLVTCRVAAVVNDLTAAEWLTIRTAWDDGCAYCGVTGRPLQRDCVMAISRGGRYTVDNVVPACGPCNASKCNDEVTGWLRRKRLDERAFLERYVRIRAEILAQVSAGQPPTE